MTAQENNEQNLGSPQSGPSQPGFSAGGVKIIPLSEGSFTIDRTKVFVPFDEDVHNLQERPVGSLLVEIQPFALVTSKDVLVLDTGLGFLENGELQIHKNLKAAGIQPKDVTKVLLSHLHKDHAGGISFGESRQWLSFPEATYYLQERELNFALEKGLPSFHPDEIEVLKDHHQVQLLHDDSGVIDDYIFYEHTGAHSPWHQAFWIKENGETIFFGGDVAPQLQQMKIRYKTKYDYDPEKAVAYRQEWWDRGNRDGWTFLFYHDIKTPVYGPLFPQRRI